MIVPDLTLDELVAVFGLVDAARRGTDREHIDALNALGHAARGDAARVVLLRNVATAVRRALEDREVASVPVAPVRACAPAGSRS